MDTHTQQDSNNPINYKESEEDREHAKSQLIVDTLQQLTIKYLEEDATDFLNNIIKENLSEYDSNFIYEELESEGFFNIEIIYYSKAIKYLAENDASLGESINISLEIGLSLENINSEALASLHASRDRENKYFEFVAPELDKIYNN
jgi:hypothetical protein